MIVLCIIYELKALSGFLTPLVAIITVYIAYQQHSINKQKLKLDLYGKRYRIFVETKNILHKINQDAIIDLIELRDFMFSTNDRLFLFQPEINEFILDIKAKAIEFNHSTKNLERNNKLNVGSKAMQEQIEQHAILTKWFTYEYENIENRFLKYLDFKKL